MSVSATTLRCEVFEIDRSTYTSLVLDGRLLGPVKPAAEWVLVKGAVRFGLVARNVSVSGWYDSYDAACAHVDLLCCNPNIGTCLSSWGGLRVDYEIWHVVADSPASVHDEVRRERIWCFLHGGSAYVLSFPTSVSYRLAIVSFRRASGCRGLAHCVPLRGWGYDQLDSALLRDCEHVYYRNVGNPCLCDMRGFGVIR